MSFNRNVWDDGNRKPLRTLKELAEEFGVTFTSLSKRMHNDPDGPRPKYYTGVGGVVRNTWHDPDQVRAWWKLEVQRAIQKGKPVKTNQL